MNSKLLTLKLKENNILLIISKAEDILSNNLTIIKELVRTNDEGLLITINKPYITLKQLLDDKKIDTKKIFFVDLITATATSSPERKNDVLFINSPRDLTALGIAIDQALNSMTKNRKFIFMDNLSTFLIYNQKRIVTEFIHYITSKMRIHNTKGTIMSAEKEMDDEFISKVESFCDDVLRLDKK